MSTINVKPVWEAVERIDCGLEAMDTNSDMMNLPGTKMLNEKAKLRDLLTLIGSTKGIRKPTPKTLRLYHTPVAVYSTRNYRMVVYDCGFAVSVWWKRYTIVRVDTCGDYSYDTIHADMARQKGSACRPDVMLESLLDAPWPVRSMLTADDQHEENNDQAAHRMLSEHPEVASNVQQYNRWIHGGSVEDAVIDKIMMEEVRKALTDKQRKVIELYYDEGFNQTEIARMLHLTPSSVNQHIRLAINRFRKYMAENS